MKEMTLELTNMCPNNCLHCSSESNMHRNTFLSLERIEEVVDEYQPHWVYLSGGEPMLHPEFFEILAMLKMRGIGVKLYTSGLLLNEHTLSDLADLHLDAVCIPVYSVRKCVFNHVTQSNTFDRVIDSLIKCVDSGIKTEVQIVPMSVNLFDLEQTIDKVLALGVRRVNILRLVPQGRAARNGFLVPDHDMLSKIILKLMSLNTSKYDGRIKIGRAFTGTEVCVAGKDKVVVIPKGDILPCETYKDGICKCNKMPIKQIGG